jgi:hypothetical protein
MSSERFHVIDMSKPICRFEAWQSTYVPLHVESGTTREDCLDFPVMEMPADLGGQFGYRGASSARSDGKAWEDEPVRPQPCEPQG